MTTQDELPFEDGQPDDCADCALIDWARSATLGGHGWAVWAVRPDGSDVAWLLSDLEPHETVAVDAPHERLGKLPAEYRERLGMRCPATTRAGRQCRNWVTVPGSLCSVHEGSRGPPVSAS